MVFSDSNRFFSSWTADFALICMTNKQHNKSTNLWWYLFVVPVMVKSDVFFLLHHPVFYLHHDVLKEQAHSLFTSIRRTDVQIAASYHFLTYSGFNFLSPPLTAVFSSLSKIGSIISSSFSRSSSWMISMSLTGSTLPSTWMMSSSSNAP